jgi:hypothetical protein
VGHLEGAHLIPPRPLQLREGEVRPYQATDLPRPFGQLRSSIQLTLRRVEVVPFIAEIGHPYVDDSCGGQQVEAFLGHEPQHPPERFFGLPQAAPLRLHPGVQNHARERPVNVARGAPDLGGLRECLARRG